MSAERIRDGVRRYYEGKLREHGATPLGVDWKSQESQELRFRELAGLWAADPCGSLIDYGCGYGALAAFVRGCGHSGPYTGFDLSGEMIGEAARQFGHLPACRFTAARAELAPADYTVSSGIFNVKMDASDEHWRDYLQQTIADMASLSMRGFAFNALTLYSDVEKRRPDLYYADPLELFDHCKRTYSRFVTLLHDYPLYEFTLLVRL